MQERLGEEKEHVSSREPCRTEGEIREKGRMKCQGEKGHRKGKEGGMERGEEEGKGARKGMKLRK